MHFLRITEMNVEGVGGKAATRGGHQGAGGGLDEQVRMGWPGLARKVQKICQEV